MQSPELDIKSQNRPFRPHPAPEEKGIVTVAGGQVDSESPDSKTGFSIRCAQRVMLVSCKEADSTPAVTEPLAGQRLSSSGFCTSTSFSVK